MVGSSIDGFDTMTGLSESSELAVFEGDEYLTSPIDRRPKFHLYKPDIAIITGIAWDHMNVFPTFDNYLEQFRIFVSTIEEGGTLIYFSGDKEVKSIAENARPDIRKIPYTTHGYFQNKTGFYGATHNRVVPLKIFGEHNLQNLSAAREACFLAGITEDEFYEAIRTFSGTSRRLQLLKSNEKGDVFLDFAHAPSKVKATLNAVKEKFQSSGIIACFELHTFSSLSKEFLPQYAGTLSGASRAFVYFNPHAVEMKKLPPLSKDVVASAFGGDNVEVYDNPDEMFSRVKAVKAEKPVFLLMSSGDFGGKDLAALSDELLSNK